MVFGLTIGSSGRAGGPQVPLGRSHGHQWHWRWRRERRPERGMTSVTWRGGGDEVFWQVWFYCAQFASGRAKGRRVARVVRRGTVQDGWATGHRTVSLGLSAVDCRVAAPGRAWQVEGGAQFSAVTLMATRLAPWSSATFCPLYWPIVKLTWPAWPHITSCRLGHQSIPALLITPYCYYILFQAETLTVSCVCVTGVSLSLLSLSPSLSQSLSLSLSHCCTATGHSVLRNQFYFWPSSISPTQLPTNSSLFPPPPSVLAHCSISVFFILTYHQLTLVLVTCDFWQIQCLTDPYFQVAAIKSHINTCSSYSSPSLTHFLLSSSLLSLSLSSRSIASVDWVKKHQPPTTNHQPPPPSSILDPRSTILDLPSSSQPASQPASSSRSSSS